MSGRPHEPVSVTVVVPFYGSKENLRSLVSSLECQTFPRKSIEIIIIDNNPKQEIFEYDFTALSNLTIIHFSIPGSYAARNKGVAMASGKIIAFTDADCIPEPNWISEGVDGLKEMGADCIGGKLEMFSESFPPTVAEIYDIHFGLQQEKFVNKLGFAATANLFTYRYVLERTGLFNSELKSSGDKEWCFRAKDNGFTLKYCDNAIVRHPARRSVKEILKKVRRKVGGKRDYRLSSSAPLAQARQTSSEKAGQAMQKVLLIAKHHGLFAAVRILFLFVAIELTKIYESIMLLAGKKSSRA